MSSLLNGWSEKIILQKYTTEIIDYESVNTVVNISFLGSVQPFNSQELQVLDINQKTFQWLKIYTSNKQSLNVGDRIKYKGKTFKIMESTDWSVSGYFKYILCEDYA